MKPINQPSLPTLTDWTEPQTVRGSELVQLITQANVAGFRAHRMRVLPCVVYEVSFYRLPEPTKDTQ